MQVFRDKLAHLNPVRTFRDIASSGGNNTRCNPQNVSFGRVTNPLYLIRALLKWHIRVEPDSCFFQLCTVARPKVNR